MNRRRQRVETRNQRGCGSVQKFVGNAVNLRLPDRGSLRPSALAHDFCERHALTGSAPGRNDDLGIQSNYFFGGNLPARRAQKFAARCLYQFRHPALRCDDRLTPLFAEHAFSAQRAHLYPYALNLSLHPGNDLGTSVARSGASRNHGDVGVNVIESARSKPQKSHAGFQNLRDRRLLIGNSCDHEIRLRCENLGGLRGPRIGDDEKLAGVELGHDLSAVLRARDHPLQRIHASQDSGGARL